MIFDETRKPFKISEISIHPKCKVELLKENEILVFKEKRVFICKDLIETVGVMDYKKADKERFYRDAKMIINYIYYHPDMFTKYVEICCEEY